MAAIRVLVSGAGGHMGRTVMEAVMAAPDLVLVGGADPAHTGKLLSALVADAPDVAVTETVAEAIETTKPDVMVDFTGPAAVMGNVRTALAARVACVVGTTGLSHGDIDEVASLCREYETPAVIAPNFSIGANLMMKFAAEAAALMDYAAIIESHHEGKLDAPSGTALATAERMVQARGDDFESRPTEYFALEGVRGGTVNGISIHSIRMAGVVANQSVVFGGPGETLSIEHVTTGRECFMPGVLLAIREVRELEGLIYGLEELLIST